MKRNRRPRTLAAPGTVVTDMQASQTRAFFMKPESYCSIDLPPYFTFKKVLAVATLYLRNRSLDQTLLRKAKQLPDVNHTMLSNKDGRYAWRPFQLIHPVLYVSLVNLLAANWAELQKRFADFAAQPVSCCSLPRQSTSKRKDRAVQIHNWWESVERESLRLVLEFTYIFHADVTDCYGTIYTHSLAWALHGKVAAKTNRKTHLLGNALDAHLQAMHHGQTNGIPQGSALMDFVAELVLGHADITNAAKLSHTQAVIRPTEISIFDY